MQRRVTRVLTVVAAVAMLATATAAQAALMDTFSFTANGSDTVTLDRYDNSSNDLIQVNLDGNSGVAFNVTISNDSNADQSYQFNVFTKLVGSYGGLDLSMALNTGTVTTPVIPDGNSWSTVAYAYASDGDTKTSGFSDFVQSPATFSFLMFEDANETGFSFLGGSTGVQLSIDAAAYAGEVTVEYLVPEPVTMSMIAFGGVALFRRKRKR